jgi:Uma2 family endonuclease
MATAFKAPITVEQYKAFEGYPGLKDELINGEIVLSPQPKPLHQQVALNVMDLLRAALKEQAFVVQANSNIDFGAAYSMPAPDVFVIAQSEWKRACDEDDYLRVAPALVVEVLSPANKKPAVEKKVSLYLKNGVHEVWLVHPKQRTFVRVTQSKRAGVKGVISLPLPLIGKVALAEVFRSA